MYVYENIWNGIGKGKYKLCSLGGYVGKEEISWKILTQENTISTSDALVSRGMRRTQHKK